MSEQTTTGQGKAGPKRQRTSRRKLPVITTLALCEKVLVEKDEMRTMVRIIDSITACPIGRESAEEMPTIRLDIFVVMILRAEGASGMFDLGVAHVTPTGVREGPSVMSTQIPLESGEDISNNIFRVGISTTEIGRHWFEAVIDGEVVSRVPLLLRYDPTPIAEGRQ